MPSHRPPEASIALLRHGYRWSDRIRSELPEGSDPDAVPARMLGRPAIVLRGPDGVRAFTDTELVRRRGAIPGAVGNVLFGRGAVHGLDDAEHVRRKALFVRATTPDSVRSLVDEVELRWLAASRSWRPGREVAVEEEAVRVIGRAVLHWAGIQCPAEEADRVARRMAAIVDGFGVVGPANLEARWSRRRSDAWAARLIHCARRGEPAPRRGALPQLVGWGGRGRRSSSTSSARCTTAGSGRTLAASTPSGSSAARRSSPTRSSPRVVARSPPATAVPERTSCSASSRSPARCWPRPTGSSPPRTSTSPRTGCPPDPRAGCVSWLARREPPGRPCIPPGGADPEHRDAGVRTRWASPRRGARRPRDGGGAHSCEI